jgi:Fe-S-cluster containining protein
MNADSNAPVYFDCTLCGECCSSWNIPIEAEKAHRLLEKPWVQARLDTTHRQLQAVSESLYRIPLTDENVCVFLADDRRCLIEANEGISLKPHECQRFPFASIQMPDGSRQHDTSAACKRISEKLLLAFQPILPKPKTFNAPEASTPSGGETLDKAPEPDILELLQAHENDFFDALESFPERVAVGIMRTCTHTEYERWHQHAREIFSQSINPKIALKQAFAALPQQTSRFNRKNIPLNPKPLSTGRGAKQSSDPYKPSNSWIANYLTLFFLRKPYRSLTWVKLLGGKQYEDPRIFGLPVDLQARKRVAWDEAVHPHINAFLYNILSRKLPLARGMSLVSLLAMAGCAELLVQWHATTLAAMRGDTHVTIPDVTGAIRLTERYYTGHQPRFMQVFHSRWKGKLIATLLWLGR